MIKMKIYCYKCRTNNLSEMKILESYHNSAKETVIYFFKCEHCENEIRIDIKE